MAAALLNAALLMPYFNILISTLEANQELAKSVIGSVSGGAVDGSQIQSVLSTLKVMPDDDKIKVVEKVQEVVGSTGIDSLAQYVTSQEHRNTLFGVLQQAATKK